jgi:hypothetical protein
MKTSVRTALAAACCAALLPATALAATHSAQPRAPAQAGVSSPAVVTALTTYASTVFGLSVTVSNARGGRATRAACGAGQNPLTGAVAAACRRASGAFAAGSVTTTTGMSGLELIAGDSVHTVGGRVVGRPLTIALAQGNTFGYLRLAVTAGFPSTAATALSLLSATFPTLSHLAYAPQSALRGSYVFHAAAWQGVRSSPLSAARALWVVASVAKNASGQTIVAAAVATGAYVALVR